MANEVATAVSEIVTVLKTIPALKYVTGNPPEQVSYDTYAVVYPNDGGIDVAPVGTREGLHNIAVDVLRQRTDLARDTAALYPLIDSVSDKLLGEMTYDSDGNQGSIFNDSISTFGKLSYSWIQTDYGGVPVVGYHFLMEEVKILVNS